MLSEVEYARALRRAGKPRCPTDPLGISCMKQMAEADEARLCELWARNLTLVEIGKLIGRDRRVVGRWAAQLGLPRRKWRRLRLDDVWSSEDDAFVLENYQRASKRWIARNLPSGRKVTKHAVIGRHWRLEKNRQRAGQQHQQGAASG